MFLDARPDTVVVRQRLSTLPPTLPVVPTDELARAAVVAIGASFTYCDAPRVTAGLGGATPGLPGLAASVGQVAVARQAFGGVQNVNLVVRRGELLGIVGVVGSGKTSLLHGLMGLMVRNAGVVALRGSVGYTSQNAWIFNDTLKNNVLFGAPYDAAAFAAAVTSCALAPDLKLVGSRRGV